MREKSKQQGSGGKPAKATSTIKPSELAVTVVREPGGYNRLARVGFDGRRALVVGERSFATTDGKTFHPRGNPGNVWAMTTVDGVFYGCGGPLVVSRDFGQTWTEIKVTGSSDRFVITRHANGTWWMGSDDEVLTSRRPDGGWKKAPFKGHGKVLSIVDIDGKLFCAGVDSGVWDGKKYTRFKGTKRTDTLTRIAETPAGTLVAIGDGGVAYRSTNRGASWQPIKIPAKGQDLEDFAWVAGALFVVGGGGTILRSTNDGKSFTRVASPTTYKLWGIGSWGDGAFLCGERGVLLRLASPADTFWKGAKDELAPPPPTVDSAFVPPSGARDREATFARLHAQALAAYTPTPDKRAADPNPELARLVEADAEGTTDALEVYADWLQGQGDPRGELATLQLARARSPKDKALAKAEKQLLAKHAEAFLGPFAELPDVAQLEWRGGFIRAARIANTFDRDPDVDGDESSEVDIAQLVGELLDHPSARFLRELDVGIVTFTDNSYDEITRLIGKRHLPAMRSLCLGSFSGEETELSWSDLGNAQPLYAALPGLRTLRLRSGSMSLGKILHPTLETFEVETGGLDPKAAKAIATAVWPSLRSLSLMVGQERYGGTTRLKDLRPILAGDNLPRLRHLGLKNLTFTDDVIEPLAVSRLLPQLEVLDLGLGTLSDEGVRRLYRYQKAFQHLARLHIHDNYVSKQGLKLLRTLRIPLEVGRQRDDHGDPANRYAAIGE